MSQPMSSRTPSDRALEFGSQYADVLERWSELFAAAAGLVRANVELGEMAQEASREFEEWLQSTQSGPFTWFNPEMIQQFMQRMAGPAGPRPPGA